MKKAILTLLITAFIIVSVMINIQYSTSSTLDDSFKMGQTHSAYYHDLEDSLQKYANETNERVSNYKKQISEANTKSAAVKKGNVFSTVKMAEGFGK